MKKKRTLYECSHAQVTGKRVRCCHGHPFSLKSEDGGIAVKRLARGEPLALDICQVCGDFDCMGPSIPEEKRGWLKKEEAPGNGGRPDKGNGATAKSSGK